MTAPSEYLRIFRTRWSVFALAVLFAVVAVAATMPSSPHRQGYKATRTIILRPELLPSSGAGTPSEVQQRLKVAARFLRSPQLSTVVVENLDLSDDPTKLANRVAISVNKKIGGLNFLAKDPDPAQAARLADAFAESAIVVHHEVEEQAYEAEAGRVQEQVDGLTAQLEENNAAIAADPAGGSGAQKSKREALSNQLRLAVEHQSELVGNGPPVERFVLGPPAVAKAAKDKSEELNAPQSWWARTALATSVALVIAAAIVLMLDRFDTRVRARGPREWALGLPVLAEVPTFARDSTAVIHTADDPTSAVAEAFHRVRSALMVAPSVPRVVPADPLITVEAATTHSSGPRARLEPSPHLHKAQIVVVVSPAQGEGRTTVVANLAASLAEAEHRILVVDADLRGSALGQLFDAGNGPGLSDVVLDTAGGSALTDVAQPTTVRHVRLVSVGAAVASPGRLMQRVAEVLEQCRGRDEIVVVDTPPMLAFSDAIELLPVADAVIVVARAGHTTAESVEHTVELLARFRARVLGVVLNGTAAERSKPGATRPGISEPPAANRDIPVSVTGDSR